MDNYPFCFQLEVRMGAQLMLSESLFPVLELARLGFLENHASYSP